MGMANTRTWRGRHTKPLTEIDIIGWEKTLSRDESGRKRSVNTKTITVFIFLSETKSKTVTPETETMSVFRKHR
jgi:hypothetical protein